MAITVSFRTSRRASLSSCSNFLMSAMLRSDGKKAPPPGEKTEPQRLCGIEGLVPKPPTGIMPRTTEETNATGGGFGGLFSRQLEC
jgi:hypothetical protein